MNESTTSTEHGVVRQHEFVTNRPAEVEVHVNAGRVDVELVGDHGASVTVRRLTEGGDTLVNGLSGLFNWVNSQFVGGEQDAPTDEAVKQTRVEQTGNRLVVRGPQGMPLRVVPLSIVVRVPRGSHVNVTTGSAAVNLTGATGAAAGRIDLTTSSGDVTVDRTDGSTNVQTGTGTVRLGPVHGTLRAKSGNGALEISAVHGPSKLVTTGGDVWLGAVQHDVEVRTGSGDLTVADAASGRVHLASGSGSLRIGVRQGIVAELDLLSVSGEARSELPVFEERQSGWDNPALRIEGRTASGNVLVTTSVS
ncbi:DUF4097 domain-containing protein [Allokutzneria sp. A3M-2-11 16]|uniref:DUF4097 family beta strand repeat-containing protein n=1 Tax=Allokutzneria sp. A3M-2-11 16 TaxID=2962043 RepID=UPI0020B900DA|nr:DUF4097 family beta strand repeat-containing protein [Allokutzneria sp. A3M-2-11 16]MCP3797823.1 DUF4097 domain-containing protein [Allokutzneria sp. A3M-2-11 16]